MLPWSSCSLPVSAVSVAEGAEGNSSRRLLNRITTNLIYTGYGPGSLFGLLCCAGLRLQENLKVYLTCKNVKFLLLLPVRSQPLLPNLYHRCTIHPSVFLKPTKSWNIQAMDVYYYDIIVDHSFLLYIETLQTHSSPC